MFKKVADYLTYMRNHDFRLEGLEAERLLEDCLDYLSLMVNLKGKKIYTSSAVPYLHRNKIFNLTEKYQELEEAVLLLSECFDETKGALTEEWKRGVEILIGLYYKLQQHKQCIVNIFDKKRFGVSGFMALVKEEDILIFPFALNEDDNYYRLY